MEELRGTCSLCGKEVSFEQLNMLADYKIRAMALQVMNGGKAVMPDTPNALKKRGLHVTSLFCPVCKEQLEKEIISELSQDQE